MNMDLEYYKRNAAPGYRFLPKDCHMLRYLLWKKRRDPRANLFKDVHLYDYDPDELQRKFGFEEEDEWYGFFTQSKPLKRSRMGRKAGNGRWKVTIGDSKIPDHVTKPMGFKKRLRFSFVRDGQEEKTGWNMVEYRLEKKDNLFLCKIYKSRGSRKCSEALEDENLCMSSMADNEVDMSITSSDSVRCSKNVLCRIYLKTSSPSSHSVEAIDTGKECVPMPAEEVEPGHIPPSASCPPLTFQNVVLACPTGKGIIDPDDPPLNKLNSADSERDLESWIAELVDNEAALISLPEIDCEVQPMASLPNGSFFNEDCTNPNTSRWMEELAEFTTRSNWGYI